VVGTEDRLITAAFRLYPNWWRERYLKEVQVVIDDLAAAGRSRWAITLNLVIGALRARLRAEGMPRTYDLWARRTSTVVALATLPGLVPFMWLLYGPRQPASPHSPATVNRWSIWVALALLIAAFLLIAIIFWVYTALRRGVLERAPENRKRLRMLARLPRYLVLSALCMIVAWFYARPSHVIYRTGRATVPLNGNPLLATVLVHASGAALLIGAAAFVLLLIEIARHGHISLQSLASAVSITHITVVLLWLMTASAATFGALSGSGIVKGAYLMAFPSGRSLVLLTSFLGVLAVAATIGAASAGRSLRVAKTLAT
jgi:hypothetical protein